VPEKKGKGEEEREKKREKEKSHPLSFKKAFELYPRFHFLTISGFIAHGRLKEAEVEMGKNQRGITGKGGRRRGKDKLAFSGACSTSKVNVCGAERAKGATHG